MWLSWFATKDLRWRIKVGKSSEDGNSLVVDDLRDSLHLVAVHVGGRVGDAASEVSKRGREGLADGLGVGAEGLDLVSSCVVDGDELCHTGQDGLVGLGLGSEDGREVAPVVDEVDADGVTTVGIARKRVWVEEHAIANRGGWAGGAVGVEVLVVHLANAARDTRSEERRHEVDVGTDERRVLSESALVEDSL